MKLRRGGASARDKTMPRGEPKESPAFPALSKRAARRLIQRAWVLVGRDRTIRQHLREASLSMLWVLEDWDLEWTVVLDRGCLEFYRGRVGKPQATFRRPTAAEFFAEIETWSAAKNPPRFVGDPVWRKLIEPVFTQFAASLRSVVANPIDDDGVKIL